MLATSRSTQAISLMNIVASSLNNVVIVTKFIMWSLNTTSSLDLYFKSDQAMAGIVNPTMALKVMLCHINNFM